MSPNPDGAHALFESDLKDASEFENLDQNGNIVDDHSEEPKVSHSVGPTKYTPIPYKKRIVWYKLIFVTAAHVFAVIGLLRLHLICTETMAFFLLLGLMTSLGIQVGAHRLWAHRSFEASFGLRLLLALCNTVSLQTAIYEWVRDHRGHHKWSDTDADPYCANRGFWFSHVGWVFLNKHPEVIRKGKTIDMSDLEADPIVMFQKKYYIPLVLVFYGLLPTVIPMYFWGESLSNALLICVFLRHVYTLNTTWLVNSWAHMFGHRPYDKRINPVEASIRHLLAGEGFHNFHHAFPWDYSASELGPLDVFNPATSFIDLFAKLGMATNLKKVNAALVEKKMSNLGDPKRTYKGGNALGEWVGGLVSLFSPLMLVRWTLMAIYGTGTA